MNWHPKVFLLQISNFTSGLGNSIVMIAIPWLILERTDSPAFAGLVLALSAIPGLLISPIGGWLVDHLGRRSVSIGADILSSISVMAFPLVGTTIGLSNSAFLVIAVLGAMFDPAGYTARRTLLTDVSKASKIDLDRLNGIHDGFLGVAWIFGPAVGAWLISTVGAINSFWVSAGLFLIAALSIMTLKVGDSGREFRSKREAQGEKSDNSLRIGFKLLWSDRLLRTITLSILVIAAVYLPTESVVLPTYFEESNNPGGLGLVISALATGSAITAFGYGWISERISRKSLVRITLIGSALSIIPMAFLPTLPILVVAGL
jgi:MFS family permease